MHLGRTTQRIPFTGRAILDYDLRYEWLSSEHIGIMFIHCIFNLVMLYSYIINIAEIYWTRLLAGIFTRYR